MNLLVIAPTPFFADRGCHMRIYEEVRALQRLGHRPLVATYHVGQDPAGVEVHRIPGLLFWYRKLEAGSSAWKPLLDLLLLLTCLRLSRTRRFDAVVGCLHEGALIGWLWRRVARQRVPLVFDYQGSLTGEIHSFGATGLVRLLLAPLRVLERWIDRSADRVVCSSDAVAHGLVEESGVPVQRVTIIPDGVDTELFAPREPDRDLKERLGLGQATAVVGYLGVLGPHEGTELLLQAAPAVLREAPTTRFLVMGYPDEDRYRQLARALGIEHAVTFTGRVSYFDAARHLALANVLVAPKVSTVESHGKLYVYMALGIPVVAFDTPVNREILGDLGVFARPGDTADLAARIVGILADPAEQRESGRRLRDRVVRHGSWQSRDRCWEKVLTGVNSRAVSAP